jgi:hypothetical protein
VRRLRALTGFQVRRREGGRRPPSHFPLRAARAAAALAAPLAVVACSVTDGGGEEATPTGPRSGAVTVGDRGEVSVSWVSENELRLAGAGRRTLAAAVNATLIGTLAPVAVPNTSSAAVAYSSWRGRRPILRIRDHPTGIDTVLDEGAHSAAWASNGALAYFKALRPEVSDPRRYLGHVVVRSSRRAQPRAWTSRPGRYVVAAWARGSVLFYRLGKSFPDLFALDGPRRERLLVRSAALVALSPDGRRAFVSRYAASPPLVRVVDIASGADVARLQVDADVARYVAESGSWVGGRVFAATTTGIVVFRVADGIAVEQVLRTERAFPLGISEARALAGGDRIMAWGELEPTPRQAVSQAALVECERATLRCVRAAVTSAAAPPRPLYNPSRP